MNAKQSGLVFLAILAIVIAILSAIGIAFINLYPETFSDAMLANESLSSMLGDQTAVFWATVAYTALVLFGGLLTIFSVGHKKLIVVVEVLFVISTIGAIIGLFLASNIEEVAYYYVTPLVSSVVCLTLAEMIRRDLNSGRALTYEQMREKYEHAKQMREAGA